MKSTYTALMNSKYFDPAFNSALFDGPVRIYFAQAHESMALKIYFTLQRDFPEELQKAKSLYKNRGSNVLVMIYPTSEAFHQSFGEDTELLKLERLGSDMVLGINGPVEDETLNLVLQQILKGLQKLDVWEEPPALAAL